MSMKKWNIFIYNVIISFFVFYNLVFLIILFKNHSLSKFYVNSEDYSVIYLKNNMHHPHFFNIYGLSLLSVLIGLNALIISLFSNFVFKSSNQKKIFYIYVITFMFIIFSTVLSFISQFSYEWWNQENYILKDLKNNIVLTKADIYINWFCKTIIWINFGLFFGLIFACIFILFHNYIIISEILILENSKSNKTKFKKFGEEINKFEDNTKTIKIDLSDFKE